MRLMGPDSKWPYKETILILWEKLEGWTFICLEFEQSFILSA